MAVWAARRMSADLGSAVQVMILARAISLSLLMGTSALSTWTAEPKSADIR